MDSSHRGRAGGASQRPSYDCYDASITYFADAAKLAGAELTYLPRFSMLVPRMLNSDGEEVSPMEFYALWGKACGRGVGGQRCR
ncbi:hypothetical protein GCM10010365_72700 [Streptomyces poonensis]|uniref:Uncharacterized protein n=1 Tax=Streptomyces poonensis TaxID=68255 RepID=A0A918UXG0_9ACTN|nr:hypothetical protein GCM10010365_72700 [Streptomyces poonensis]